MSNFGFYAVDVFHQLSNAVKSKQLLIVRAFDQVLEGRLWRGFAVVLLNGRPFGHHGFGWRSRSGRQGGTVQQGIVVVPLVTAAHYRIQSRFVDFHGFLGQHIDHVQVYPVAGGMSKSNFFVVRAPAHIARVQGRRQAQNFQLLTCSDVFEVEVIDEILATRRIILGIDPQTRNAQLGLRQFFYRWITVVFCQQHPGSFFVDTDVGCWFGQQQIGNGFGWYFVGNVFLGQQQWCARQE